MVFTRPALPPPRDHVISSIDRYLIVYLDEENAKKVCEGLKRVEGILAKSEFIVPGAPLTEADIRLYTTILRFDPVYFGHFKCNLLAVKDCPNILRWLRQVTATPGVKETINMDHIKVFPSIAQLLILRL